MPPPTQNAEPKFRVGSWLFGAVPAGWEILEGRGLRRSNKNGFPSNVIPTEDDLQGEMTLKEYLDSQLHVVRHYFSEPQFDFRGPAKIKGVDEALMLVIRFKADDGRPAMQRQIYVRHGRRVGVLTFTTVETELPAVESLFMAILSGATFQPV
jgi:hypothetical protein